MNQGLEMAAETAPAMLPARKELNRRVSPSDVLCTNPDAARPCGGEMCGGAYSKEDFESQVCVGIYVKSSIKVKNRKS